MVLERRVVRVHPVRRQQLPDELDRVALDLVGVDLRERKVVSNNAAGEN